MNYFSNFLTLSLMLLPFMAFAQTPNSTTVPVSPTDYKIYTASGEVTTLNQLVDEVLRNDIHVLYLGEQHNDPVAHFLELAFFQAVAEKATNKKVALAMEMFERDIQTVLNEYLSGTIREQDLKKESRPWRNYDTDYKPMIEFAKAEKIPVIAGNAPARYVHLTGREGQGVLQSLSHDARRWLPPLPFANANPKYGEKFDAVMASSMAEMQKQMAIQKASKGDSTDLKAIEAGTLAPIPHSNPNMLTAQSLRDASMAWSISKFLNENPDGIVVHVNGSFHSEGNMGIPDYVPRYFPSAKQKVITMVTASDVNTFIPEIHASLGNYIVLTNEALPRSYESGF